ncbi:MAG: S-methyl-5-thioribose-1-phosphate isomerase [Candidatus Altiarchaeota archaeon]|nr:S-methyl-5-thioribose-1-phosphate isomerase [Candidatus Altiarchaeota archaeon]
MKIRGRDYRSVWMEEGVVRMIDQTLLPFDFRINDCGSFIETAEAIRTMVVRGAPAIGAAACYGMAQAALAGKLNEGERVISKTRPTARDLFDAIEYFKKKFVGSNAVEVACAYADESAERCRMIGVHGEKLIKEDMRILTHCNAGALACVDWGTALAPMRMAHYRKRKFFVWADETRPRLQGMLTSWELSEEGIENKVIADNASGYLMKEGLVDLVVVGADRVAGNGDVANKIGTYEKAVLAKENGIPFYVASPSTTFDLACASGKDIEIEDRGSEEVEFVKGIGSDGRLSRVKVSPVGCRVENPAFDVTPAGYIKGIITEGGVVKPGKVKDMKFI